MIEKLFSEQVKTPEWQQKIRTIVPSYGRKLNGDVALTQQVWDETAQTLQLTKPPVISAPATAQAATPAEHTASPQHDMAL